MTGFWTSISKRPGWFFFASLLHILKPGGPMMLEPWQPLALRLFCSLSVREKSTLSGSRLLGKIPRKYCNWPDYGHFNRLDITVWRLEVTDTVLAGLVSLETILLGLLTATFSSYKDTVILDQGPTLTTSFNLNYLLTALSPNSPIRALGFNMGTLGSTVQPWQLWLGVQGECPPRKRREAQSWANSGACLPLPSVLSSQKHVWLSSKDKISYSQHFVIIM